MDQGWAIIIAAITAGILGFFLKTFLSKSQYKLEYQKEIIRKKVEAYRELSVELGSLIDVYEDLEDKIVDHQSTSEDLRRIVKNIVKSTRTHLKISIMVCNFMCLILA